MAPNGNMKRLETFLKNLFPPPALAVDVAAATVDTAALGFAVTFFLDTIYSCVVRIPSIVPTQLTALKIPRRSLIRARNTGVLLGATAGLTSLVKHVRGKDDVHTRMMAGFGAGLLMSMVQRDPPAIVMAWGVAWALAEGGMFKVRGK